MDRGRGHRATVGVSRVKRDTAQQSQNSERNHISFAHNDDILSSL